MILHREDVQKIISNKFTSQDIFRSKGQKRGHLGVGNGKKAINQSSNVRIKHSWSHLKHDEARNKCEKYKIQHTYRLGDINFLRI